ncbi:MAG: hypothetical protein K0Q73_5211 [Paenibacillus sp.]|jgi:hypothetical protein|nr:hypothetical protein [Paenibacillus sp.]
MRELLIIGSLLVVALSVYLVRRWNERRRIQAKWDRVYEEHRQEMQAMIDRIAVMGPEDRAAQVAANRSRFIAARGRRIETVKQRRAAIAAAKKIPT